MVLHNPNNWHWVNKDTSSWAREYLEKELVDISAESDGASAKVSKILSMDGDVDVSQRKGKVITLFDVRLQTEYTGKTKDGEDVSGTITVPEVAHDTEEDEYVFEVELYNETLAKVPVKDLVRSKITPQMRKRLATLAPTLIAAHGAGIQHTKDADPIRNAMPKYSSTSAKSETHSAAAKSAQTSNASVNVTKVTDSEEFRTDAAQLYATFTDPQRIAAFTRSPPKVFEGAKVGGKFEIFDGNVTGEYTELKEPTKISQKWRLKQWPKGHYSQLDINFDQNNVDAVTTMRVEWNGVPMGQEEVTKRNWREYYVRSMKQTFGFGTIL